MGGEYKKSGRAFGIGLLHIDDSTMELQLDANKGLVGAKKIFLKIEREDADIVGLTMKVEGSSFEACFGIQTQMVKKIVRDSVNDSFLSARATKDLLRMSSTLEI